jgi:LEA14-like dessication related protein
MAVRFFRCFTLLLTVLVLPGCASLTTEMDPPKVTLESFKSIPSDSGAPRFEIKLRIQNPNEQSLNITGISYGIELLDQEVISGVTNDVPVIEGYSEGVVSLDASVQLLQVLRLLANLGQAESDALEYRFTAKIDFSGLVPTQRIEETGQVNLK